jgi:excisionase family DNA binding protein
VVKRKKRRVPPATTTIVEAARRLGIGRNQAYEAAHRGEIPVIKIGTRLLVPTKALDRLLGFVDPTAANKRSGTGTSLPDSAA